jgi:hypothetical protein
MPLYALLDYSKSRADEQNVNTYGIDRAAESGDAYWVALAHHKDE